MNPVLPMPGPAPNLMDPGLWKNLMATQQNLFAGWNSFCGCPSAKPQKPCKQPQSCQPRKPVDIHIHHHFYKNGCGGPFTSNSGSGSSSVNQSHNAFGSRAACCGWKQNSGLPKFSPFAGNGFNFGGYSSYGGGAYAAQNYGAYGGGYGNYASYGGYGGYANNGSYGNYAYQGNNFNVGSFGGGQIPASSFGDFGSSYFNGGVGSFGFPASAYGDFNFSSAFGLGNSIGSMNTFSILNGALSLLF